MAWIGNFGRILPRIGRPFHSILWALVLVFATAMAHAQADLEEPFATWNATAERAQQILENDRVFPPVLENIRAELAAQRDAAFDLSQTQSVTARALQAQLDALGPPSADGVEEDEETAARRAELVEELSQAMAPTRAAREEFERSQLLVNEIDARLRATQAERLVQRLPSPVLPTSWTGIGGELLDRSEDFSGDLATALSRRLESGELQSSLPVALLLTVAGLGLILGATPWLVARTEAARDAQRIGLRRRVFAVGVVLAHFAVPLLGAALLLVAPMVLDLEVPRGQGIINALPTLVGYLVVAHLIGSWLFRVGVAGGRAFEMTDALAARGYRLTMHLGAFLAVEGFLIASETAYRFSSETRSALTFVVVLLGAIPLWRFGRLLLAQYPDSGDTGPGTRPGLESSSSLARDLRWLVARLMQVSAALAVLAALFGYINLARQALSPMVLTLAALGLAIHIRALLIKVLQDALGETTDDETEGAFLLPLLVTMTIVLVLIPILALVWGARVTDIAEVWRILTDGVELGDTRISLTVVFKLVVVFLIGLAVTRWIQRLLRGTLLPRTRMDTGAQSSIVTGLGYVGLTLTALIAVSSAGINLSSLAVVFGALSVGIGFGLQNIVSNFVSGIILLVERPVKEGDWIEVSGYSGIVKKIAVRSTRVETFDRFDVIVPNSDLIAGTVKNMTLSNNDGRVILPVGVAYGSDVELVREVLLQAVADDPRVMTDPAPTVLFIALGASSLDFELRFYLYDVGTILTISSDVMFRIYSGLREAGIEIPFPQRDVNLKGLERLSDAIEGLGQKGAGRARDVS